MGNENSKASVVQTAGLEDNIQDIIKKRQEKSIPEHELDKELLYLDEYTELCFTKTTLKWKIARINSELENKNVKASLDKYEVKLDKIFGLEMSLCGKKFTVFALGRKDDSLVSETGIFKSLKDKWMHDEQKWYKNEYTFEAKDEKQAEMWLDEICEKTDTDWEEKDVLLIYQDDDWQALEVLREIKPMFKAANVKLEILKTKNIQDLVYSTTKLCQYRHLVVLGPDKVFHKAVNGVLTRPDFDRVTQRVVISAIPTEFGNNAVSKFMGVSHPYLSALTAIRGKPQPFDIMSVISPSGFRMFSHLNFNWGLISDIQLDPNATKTGEKVGLNLNTLFHSFFPRYFQGTLHYLPVTDEESIEEGLKPAMPVSVSTAERLAKPGPMDHMDKLDPNNLPGKWVTVDAAFSLFFATNISRLTQSLLAAPLAITSDGAFDIAYTQSGFWNFLKWIFLPSNSSHLSSKAWNFARAKAFILEPGKDLRGSDGFFTVDGEKIPCTSVRCEVHKGAIQVQAPIRKIESRATKWKANLKKWGTVLNKKRSPMVTFEEFKLDMLLTWMLSFGILILILAFFWNF